MNSMLRISYTILSILPLYIYHLLNSFLLLFIPKALRIKKNIRGQKVLITGAGSGVGRELAIEFSQHATSLILVDINKEGLLQTEKLVDPRSKVFTHVCDVSDYKKVYEMAKKVKEEVGDVDILVNNAGIVSGKYLLDLPEEKIIKTMEVNCLAHFWTIKAFLPAMADRNRGRIVNVISIAAKTGGPQLSDYCASKYGAMGLADCLDMELSAKKLDGVKLTVVCPSIIDTGLFKGTKVALGNIMTPSYVAKEIIDGVLLGETLIYLPGFYRYLFALKEFLPRHLVVKQFEISGDINAMCNFTGRTQHENEAEMKNNNGIKG